MGLKPIHISFNSKRVCSALRNYRATGTVDRETLQSSYGLMVPCRYISDPISYASDYPAMVEAKNLLGLFGVSVQDLQVWILRTRQSVDDILRGAKAVNVTPAVGFFTRMGEITDSGPKAPQNEPQHASEPSLSPA